MLAIHHNHQSILHAASLNSIASSSSSSTSAKSDLHNDERRPRIRFAPLPDPRRDVLVTDDGDELPLPSHSTSIPCPPLLAEIAFYKDHKLASPLPSLRPLEYDNDSINSNSTKRSSGGCGAGDSTSTGATTPCMSDSVSSLNTLDVNSLHTVLEEPGTPRQPPPESAKKHKSWGSKSFLRPFLRSPAVSSSTLSSASSSTATLTPRFTSAFSRLNISTPEILTLGTINLFRSRNHSSSSSSSTDHDHQHHHHHLDTKLTRFTSSSSSFGSPLARSQSLTSESRTRTTSAPASSLLSSNPRTPTLPKRPSTANGHPPHRKGKGTRMLNGRVYGHRRPPNDNPFANARDEADPEFVEWGYGGMGSVRNGAAGAGHWSKLQRSGVSVGADESSAATQRQRRTSAEPTNEGGGEDLDDGSGMGWVRRRREQREREKKEKEDRECGGDTTATEAKSAGPPAPPHADAGAQQQAGQLDPALGSSAASPGPMHENRTGGDRAGQPAQKAEVKVETVESEGAKGTKAGETEAEKAAEPAHHVHAHSEDEHILRAVTVPAPIPRRGSHHRSLSRPGTSDTETLTQHTARTEQPAASQALTLHERERGRPPRVRAEESETDEESESPERSIDGDGDDEGGSEEDEEEDEDADAGRKTSVGAGVEKISRHK